MRFDMRRPLLAVMMMLVLGLVIAGCGSDDDKTTASSDQPAAMGSTGSGDSMNSSDGVEVGGAMMTPDRNIVENAADASNVTTLVAAVKQAGLAKTLSGTGPFTVFAPDNAAFAKVPKKTLNSLMENANKKQLASILTYHVVAGDYDAAKIMELAKQGKTLKTVQGGTLTPVVKGGKVEIEDENGGTVTVTQADVKSSNGVTHIINGVLMPKS